LSQSATTYEKETVRSPDIVGTLAVLTAAACWGTSALFVKLILRDQQVSALA
jgi:hypothetical protein